MKRLIALGSAHFREPRSRGVAWRFGKKTSFHLGYRYVTFGSSVIDVDDEAVDLGDQGAHVIEAGFTFRF